MARPRTLATILALACAILGPTGCAGEGRREAHPPAAIHQEASARPRSEATAPAAEPSERSEQGAPADPPSPPGAPTEPDFDAPMPEEPCPAEVRVRLAHRSAPELPPLLERAVAFRSIDGRHLRVAISNGELDLDARGRFPAPSIGEARFELDAVRQRRRPLEPMVLGAPDSVRGALTHVRIVGAGPVLTFGHRDIGRVELTEITEERVCGRIDLNDGFGRVRGAFVAPVMGPLPE